LFLVDNTITAIQGKANVRNRAARITGWADEVAGTAQATEQKYYGSL
jgi:phosphoserine phosphatase